MSHPHPELPLPPPLAEGGLRLVALGGLGEIGRNMTVFEYDGRLLVVDCGVLFPEPDQPGVDLILPDFRYLEGRFDLIDAVVLTHAHEDHIGAIPYLLRNRADIPLIGSRLTLALVKSKLTEHRITPVVDEVAEGTRQQAGPFDLEFFSVNHSIPDALAVAIRTPAGLAKLCALYGDTYDVLLGRRTYDIWAPSGQQLPAARCQTASTLAGSMSRRTVPRG